MKKAEELYMKHIYVTEGQTDNVQNTSRGMEVTINEVNSMQKPAQYNQGTWKSKKSQQDLAKTEQFPAQTTQRGQQKTT